MPITTRASWISLENTHKNEYSLNWEATVLVTCPPFHTFHKFHFVAKETVTPAPRQVTSGHNEPLRDGSWSGWVWHLPLWPLELWLPVATSWLQKPAVHSSRRPQWNGRADMIAFMLLFICIEKKEISICTCMHTHLKQITTNLK